MIDTERDLGAFDKWFGQRVAESDAEDEDGTAKVVARMKERTRISKLTFNNIHCSFCMTALTDQNLGILRHVTSIIMKLALLREKEASALRGYR